MGGKQSTTNNSNSPRVRTFSGAVPATTAAATATNASPNHGSGDAGSTGSGGGNAAAVGLLRSGGTAGAVPDSRQRARSLSSVPNGHSGPINVPPGNGTSNFGGPSGSPDSDTSTPEDHPFGRVFVAHSLPTQLWSFNGIKCPVCSKFVLPDDVECHLVMCLTKPRISYNEDILTEDKGECVICLDDLKQGDTIARLPCLCIYHKSCIDSWFEVNRSCPEHPLD